MRSSTIVLGVIQRWTRSNPLLCPRQRFPSLLDVLPTFVIAPPRGQQQQQRFASRRAAATDQDPGPNDDLAAARRWLADLDVHTVPRHLAEIAFSRSGGPGGQNVNKVNSKATLKIPLEALLPFVPKVVHPQLLASRYVAQRSNSLVIQSEESRKQALNVESCFEKLYRLLRSSAEEAIPGETSQHQKDRVHRLRKADWLYRKKAENEARIKSKKMLSSKKSSRRGSKDD